MANKAGFLALDEIPDAVRDFCSHYFDQDAYRSNPVVYFREKFEGWLRIRLSKKAKPQPRKNGRDGPPKNGTRQSSEPEAYTGDFVLKVFRGRYGTLAESLSQTQINRLASARYNTELESWMEGMYNSLKGQNGTARTGPVQLGAVPVAP